MRSDTYKILPSRYTFGCRLPRDPLMSFWQRMATDDRQTDPLERRPADELEHQRGRVYKGLAPNSSGTSDGSRHYAPHENPDRLPLPIIRRAEDEVGRPIYCRYAWINASETSCVYAVVGPKGFCWANGNLTGAAWEIDIVPWLVNTHASRWVLETPSQVSSRALDLDSSVRKQDLQPFDYLARWFLDLFGLFPSSVQVLFQEPFEADAPDWVSSHWCTSSHETPGGERKYSYYQWAFATRTEVAVAIAFGIREVVRPLHTSWGMIWDELMETSWLTARGTWYAAPREVSREHDAYSLLGVSAAAGDEEIARAYRRLAKYLHPDSSSFGAGPGTPLRDFTALSAAYEAIKSREARSTYVPTRTFRSSLLPTIGDVGWWVAPENALREPIDSPGQLAVRG
ncbi:MAG: J domain-containing protein [Actinobacteria bacterium]|nr:MAG: J domain-containing protein [Actinomycetota bacterium]